MSEKIELKKEQTEAIDSKGDTIVSASAGSGKTFVMIQKLVKLIVAGTDMDTVLAVTFGKKAAAQMKDKLKKGLIDYMSNLKKDDAKSEDQKQKENEWLKEQLSKIPTANICTIHAFCGKLIRTYFYKLGVDSNFEVIAEDDSMLSADYKYQALDKLFADYYKSNDQDFYTLLECYRSKHKDDNLKRVILFAHREFVNTKINRNEGEDKYTAYMRQHKELYTDEGFNRLIEEIKAFNKDKYNALKDACKEAKNNLLFQDGRYQKYIDKLFEGIEEGKNGDLYNKEFDFGTARDLPKDQPEIKKAFTKFRDDMKESIKKVVEDYKNYDADKMQFLESGKVAIAFAKVLCDFDREYFNLKVSENKLDFNDLEHLALQLLEDEDTQEDISERFSCVFVDEYQDVNPIQDAILTKLSENRNNTFFVGDLKQAIYGFRGSQSSFFDKKFKDYAREEGKNALKIPLNFRSADNILNFVNKAFETIMTESSCNIDYKTDHEMITGELYPKGTGIAKILIFGDGSSDKKCKNEVAELDEIYSLISKNEEVYYTSEGLAIANLVKDLLQNNNTYYDIEEKDESKREKRITADDICILTRKNNSRAEEIVQALRDMNYDVSGAAEDNILECTEVKQMIDILSYIDNFEQDIPLVTTMLSPVGNFTCNDLAKIKRSESQEDKNQHFPFRRVCKNYTKSQKTPLTQRLIEFFDKIEKYKELSQILTASELIDHIITHNNLENIYSLGGGEKLRHIRRLAAEGNMPLAYFLARVKDGSKISFPLIAPSNSIKIMTMHKSKGLEFPVVILADICATYRGKNDNPLYFDDKLFFAHKHFNTENKVRTDTILRAFLSKKSKKEELKNELNLFYVACTRAKSRLYIMTQEKKEYSLVKALKADCYADLLDFDKLEKMDYVESIKVTPKSKTSDASEQTKEKQENTSITTIEYSWEKSIDLPVKSSASAILRLNAEDSYYRPHELFKGEEETSTDKGTAYHRYLELCDFSIKTPKEIEKQIANFVEKGKILKEQAALLNSENISEILNMPVFSNLNGKLYREQEFLCDLPAYEIFEHLDSNDDSEKVKDNILLQGAIDLLVEKENEYLIIDYKYSKKSDKELIDAYTKQLNLYKKVVEKIMQSQNIKTFIVNLYTRRQIEIHLKKQLNAYF